MLRLRIRYSFLLSLPVQLCIPLLSLSTLRLRIRYLPFLCTDFSKYTVIACDQYSSEVDYWKQVEKFVGDAPSTLNMIYPEAYLEEGRDEYFIERTNKSMDEYVADGVLEPFDGFVLIDHQTPNIKSRKGLLVALDLEQYDFSLGSQSLIRPTEATIESRLVPRMRIREKAQVELPHILVLIDDPEKTVIEPLFEGDWEGAYDFELMENGSHVTGYKVTGNDVIDQICAASRPLTDEENFRKKFSNAPEGAKPMLFEMGDGNQNLATAKQCWENLKKEGAEIDEHPRRR